jgi:hypothetical protein
MSGEMVVIDASVAVKSRVTESASVKLSDPG